MTDATGNSVVHYSYEPFGRPEASGPSTSNPFQFAGFENDNTGLYYYHTRYQDPELQRFVAEEPIGLGSVGVNEYVYVSNNPLISPAPTRDYAVTALPSVTRGTLLPSVNESTKPLIEAAVRIVLAIITNGASEGAFEVKEFYEIADEIADAVVAWKPVLLDLMNMKKGRPPKTWGGINYRIYTGKCDSSDLDCVLGGQSQ